MDIPKIGLGTYQIPVDQVADICLQAVDLGYRHIDTAQRYENEQGVGAAIKQMRLPREEIFLTTKIWIDAYTKEKCQKSFEESLRKLQTDYVDLVLLHRPNSRLDHRVPLDVLMDFQQQGKIKNIGVSNFTIAQLDEAIQHTGNQIYTNQIEYHVFFDPIKIRTHMHQKGVRLTAYAPFSHGDVFGNKALQQLAEKHNKSVAQICLRRLIQQENVSTLPKSTNPRRLEENIAVFDFELDKDDLSVISQLPKNQRHFNPVFHPIWDD